MIGQLFKWLSRQATRKLIAQLYLLSQQGSAWRGMSKMAAGVPVNELFERIAQAVSLIN